MNPKEQTKEIVRLVGVFLRGCGNTTPFLKDPTECESCTLDFLNRVREVLTVTSNNTIVDRGEIERLIATEAILPGENVNDKAKRILANYGRVFVRGSTCLCDYDKKEHALSCGYWPNGVIPEEYKTPNDGR